MERRRAAQAGYTIVELMIVVTIVGILATLAQPSFHASVIRARETALKHNLLTMRDVIDQYRADRGAYPPSLSDLMAAGYLRTIPMDPLTKSAATWQELPDPIDQGISDVHSGSPLVAQDGTPYNHW